MNVYIKLYNITKKELFKMALNIYHPSISNTQSQAIDNIIRGHSMAGKMLLYTKEPEILMG